METLHWYSQRGKGISDCPIADSLLGLWIGTPSHVTLAWISVVLCKPALRFHKKRLAHKRESIEPLATRRLETSGTSIQCWTWVSDSEHSSSNAQPRCYDECVESPYTTLYANLERYAKVSCPSRGKAYTGRQPSLSGSFKYGSISSVVRSVTSSTGGTVPAGNTSRIWSTSKVR